ncbi:hypothetical protein BD414DRAFT_473299 [Trametes punicea]|nr:hypothetical protein BD414DRAFT_473299 [Trametes punicea]
MFRWMSMSAAIHKIWRLRSLVLCQLLFRAAFCEGCCGSGGLWVFFSRLSPLSCMVEPHLPLPLRHSQRSRIPRNHSGSAWYAASVIR